MKILVTTPTGRIGRQIVGELLSPEFSVRVIARDPARLLPEVREQVDVIHGPMDDAVTMRRALDGMDAMFFCVPSVSWKETDVRGHYERFARVAATVIRETNTPRIVTISAVGKGRACNAGPISALHVMEDILNESGAAIRHLRCGAFMENFLCQAGAIVEHGIISSPMPGHIAIPMVATADITDAALRWLVRRDWSGVADVAVHGPEDISYNQAAALLERVLGRPVRYQEMAANTYVQKLIGHGASVEYAQSMIAMFAGLASGISQIGPGAFDTAPTTKLGEWVREALLPVIERQSGLVSCTACSA